MQMYRITFNVTQGSGIHRFALVVHPDAKVSKVFDRAAQLSRGKPCRVSWSELTEVPWTANTKLTSETFVGP